MAVARRKAIEKKDKVQRITSRKGPTGLIVHSGDGRLFFLSSKDAKRTELSSRERRTILRVLAKQDRPRGKRALEKPTACGRILRWLLSHNPSSKGWSQVGMWWIKNC